MPLSSGMSIHDDTKHKGSAKRDADSGVAALDATGQLLGLSNSIRLARNPTDHVNLYERTSGENILDFLRVGVNDYETKIRTVGGWEMVQTDNMKGIANGIVGLDANTLLSSALLPPCMEEYSNHLGAVDNFTQIGTTGNGEASTDAVNHKMDLSCGLTVVGHGRFESKELWTLGLKPIVANFIIGAVVDGVAGSRRSRFGLKADFSDYSDVNAVEFYHNNSDNWVARTFGTSFGNSQSISDIVAGDLCTIVATSSSCEFFVNGVLVHTSTTYIPTSALHVGGQAISSTTAATTARELGIDMMSLKRFI
jgi:hypothetical protein